MQESAGKSDDSKTEQDIGRPDVWGEARYQKPGEPAGSSVRSPPGTVSSKDTPPLSTPVTRRDYE